MPGSIRVAVPNKGRLAGPSVDLLRKAGLRFEVSSRALSVPVRNMPVEVLFVRADDIPELVNLQNVKGQAKPYQMRQFLKLVEKHNLKLED